MRRSERDGVEIEIHISQTLILLENDGIQRGGYMDDRALPSLSGLCLHEQLDEESAPDATSGAANEHPIEFVSNDPIKQSEYKTDKKTWQSDNRMTSGRHERNSNFRANWAPIARQDTFCYIRNSGAGDYIETEFMMPTQYILRVVSDALGFASPEDFARRQAENIYIVDGSNMLDLDSNSDKFETFEAWNNITRHLAARPGERNGKTVICITKTKNLEPNFFPMVVEDGEGVLRYLTDSGQVQRTKYNQRLEIPMKGGGSTQAGDYNQYKRLETMLCRLTNSPERVFVVAIDQWSQFQRLNPPAPRAERPCIFHNADDFATHGVCEYDDVLSLALREHIRRIAGKGADLAETRNQWYFQSFSSSRDRWNSPKFPGREWPRMVTLDYEMKNLSNLDSMCTLLAKYFQHRDVLGFHVYQSMRGFTTNFDSIIQTYPNRYTHDSDYVRLGHLTDFPFQGSDKDGNLLEWLCGDFGTGEFLKVEEGIQKERQLYQGEGKKLLNLRIPRPPGWYEEAWKEDFLRDLGDRRTAMVECWAQYYARVAEEKKTSPTPGYTPPSEGGAASYEEWPTLAPCGPPT